MTRLLRTRAQQPLTLMLLLAVFILLMPIGCTDNSEPELPQLSENTSATVLIRIGERGHGTGVAVSHCGHILTNEHVANARGGGQPLQVTVQGFTEPFEAVVIATNEDSDLAIIRIEHSFQHVVIIESDDSSIHPGDESYAIGYPLNLGRSVSRGYIRQIFFTAPMPDAPPLAYDSTMLRQRQEPGTSGSGIFSVRHGRLIGMMSLNMWGGRNIFRTRPNELVVPLRRIRPFLEANNIAYCRSSPPWYERARDTIRDKVRSAVRNLRQQE